MRDFRHSPRLRRIFKKFPTPGKTHTLWFQRKLNYTTRQMCLCFHAWAKVVDRQIWQIWRFSRCSRLFFLPSQVLGKHSQKFCSTFQIVKAGGGNELWTAQIILAWRHRLKVKILKSGLQFGSKMTQFKSSFSPFFHPYFSIYIQLIPEKHQASNKNSTRQGIKHVCTLFFFCSPSFERNALMFPTNQYIFS